MHRKPLVPLIATLAALAATLCPGARSQTADVSVLVAVAKITHPAITEMSGMAKSRRHPDTYWVHNDSGDASRVFAIRGNGSVIVPPALRNRFSADKTAEDKSVGKTEYPGIGIAPAENHDWEEVAIDGGTLYIADTGNNKNERRDLCVYVVPEPNPEKADAARVSRRLPLVYPDQTAYPPPALRFDCEAIFMVRGKLYFLTKWREGIHPKMPGTGTTLYRLDTAYTDRPNTLKLIETKRDMGGWVTASSVSPDGKTLAVLCQAPVQSVWLFDIGAGSDKFLSRPARRKVFTGAKQCESVCFDDNGTVVVGNEQRDLFRLPVAGFKPVAVR